MFETLVERVLHRVLGKYIDELDKRQLSVSVRVWLIFLRSGAETYT